MGRFILLVGIVMIVIGMAAPFFSLGGFMGNFDDVMSLATDREAREAELCEEGETLEEEQGSSTYTQGQGYGRSTTLYCVDEEGNRRDVTGDLIEGFLGSSNPDEITSMIMNMVSGSLFFFGLSCVGFILVFVGLVMMRGKRGAMVVSSYGMNPMPMQQAPAHQGLNAQLQQLEQAYQQNLISREEYDKARQDLLNKF